MARNSQASRSMRMIPVTLLALCSASAIAFADGKLSGRVIDLNEQPLGGASVIITASDGSETRVVTDPTGQYAAVVRSAGRHTVVFALGKVLSSAQVDIPADGAA